MGLQWVVFLITTAVLPKLLKDVEKFVVRYNAFGLTQI
jgi:hypothetical protein